MSIETLIPILGANLVWQTLLIALVVGIALKILPKYAVKTRYHIALAALFGSGLLCMAPFLPDVTPQISIGITPQATNPPSAVPVSVENLSPVNSEAADASETIAAVNPIPMGKILFWVWMFGSILVLARLCRAAVTAQTWARRSVPISCPGSLSLSKTIRVCRSPDVSTPLVLGFFKPTVLVPENFEYDLSNPGIRAVIEHEIAHISRGDLWTNLAQHLVLALLWWCVPLYWINSQINIEREKLCDDEAARQTGTGRALATALVDLADSRPKQQPLLAIGIHPRAHNLAERIHRLCKETPMPKISARLLLSTTLAVPVLIGSLVLVAPRAIAHSPSLSRDVDTMEKDEISSLQYALFKATAMNRADEVRQILAMGIDPAFHLHGDGSPLILAAKIGNVEIAELLLDHGAKINRMTASDESALINAVKTNKKDMVEFLVGRGADVSLGQVSNPRHRPEWRSPLSTAKKHRRTQIAQYLQSQGAVLDNRKEASKRNVSGTIVEGRLTSKYGAIRKHLDGKKHTGIDIANKEGTPIFAPADGQITEVTSNYKNNPKWGHVVVMNTNGGIRTVYAHLKDSQVSKGEFVRKGSQIARLGNTGQSTGPHVHIETRKDGELVDPLTVWTSLAR